MNFKSWLVITEAKKDINLSNPKLNTTIPPLNASLSNPKLTTIPPLNASLSNPNLTTTKISNRELASNQKVKELAIAYIKAKEFSKLPIKFISFLNDKKRAYKDYKKADGTKSTGAIWYPSDIEIARVNGLPEGWMDYRMEIYKSKNEQKSKDRLEELAIYFGRNKSGPQTHESDKKNKSLGNWLNKKKNRYNPHEKSDDINWAEIVASSKTWNKEQFPYELPDNWRNIEPNKNQTFLLKLKNQKTSSKRLEELAIYYGRNGASPSQYASDKENKILGQWHNGKKTRYNPHEESDDITWAKIVASSKNWNKKKFPYDLPEDWRNIEPAGEKSLGEEYVANILTELGIKNNTEHRDAACKNKICLPFDFSITHNGKKYLEFHGEQHYVPAYFGSGEGMTDQEKANNALKQFKYVKGNDKIKYNHCVKRKIPLLVIPYWLYKNENQDIIKSKIIEFLNTNKFDKNFANPDVPQKNKAYHDRMLKRTRCFASGKLDCKELFKKQKTTFEQFLINKNFINI